MRIFIYDTCVLLGIGAVTYAAWQVHAALAWCVAGLALIVFGFLGACKLEEITVSKEKRRR